jgi:hypothetical protein
VIAPPVWDNRENDSPHAVPLEHGMFTLIKSETKPLTPELAAAFHAMPASPTERGFDKARAKMLREKAEAGQLISFNWATARLGDKEFRVNGQHSSAVLCELNGSFPKGLKVHLDTYEVDNKDGLALLFRQFDSRKSGRTPTDVAGAYQGLHEELKDVPRAEAKIAVEGANWYLHHIEGLPGLKGDDVYTMFADANYYPFVKWVGDVFSIKTPELRKATIVAAMFGTFEKSEEEARKFWHDVARGGREYEENHPTTLLDAFYKRVAENKREAMEFKPAHYYQAAIYAWNAHRGEKPITSIKPDTKKGMLPVAS